MPFDWNRLGAIFGGGSSPDDYGYDDPDQTFNPLARPKRFGVTGSSPTQSSAYSRLFQTPPYQQQTPDAGSVTQSSRPNYLDELRKAYEPGPAITAYQKALGDQPKPEDYKPSGWRRLAASLGGIGAGLHSGPGAGIEAASTINAGPWRQAQSQYKQRIQGLGDAAKLESEVQANRAKGIETGIGLDETRRTHDETAGTNAFNRQVKGYELYQKDVEIRQAQDRLDNPDWDKIENADGSLTLWNKKNPAQTQHVAADTVAAGNLKVAKQNAATNARNAATNERTAATGERNATTAEGNLTQRTDEFNRGTMQPAQEKRARNLALEEMSFDPQWKKYVRIGKKGEEPWMEAQDSDSWFSNPVEEGSRGQREFKEELQRRIANKLSRGKVTGEGLNPSYREPKIEIGGWRPR